MSTANFGAKKLTSSLWTFAMDSDNIYNDTIENVKSELKDIVSIKGEGERAYIGDYRCIASFYIPFYNREKREWQENEYFVIIENGYYEWARFDICEDSSEYFNEDAKNTKAYNKKIDKKIKEIEKVFASYCTPLVKIATFSNGEAIYERVGSIGDILTK